MFPKWERCFSRKAILYQWRYEVMVCYWTERKGWQNILFPAECCSIGFLLLLMVSIFIMTVVYWQVSDWHELYSCWNKGELSTKKVGRSLQFCVVGASNGNAAVGKQVEDMADVGIREGRSEIEAGACPRPKTHYDEAANTLLNGRQPFLMTKHHSWLFQWNLNYYLKKSIPSNFWQAAN